MTSRVGRIVAMQGAEDMDGLDRRSLHRHRNDRRQNPAIHFKVGKAKDQSFRVVVSGAANLAGIVDPGGPF